MARYSYVVFSRPVLGQEAEYNDWYDDQHLSDVLRVPGFISARRFKSSDDQGGDGAYLAIYDIESDDPAQTLAELHSRAGSVDMPISPALDLSAVSATLYSCVKEVQRTGR